METQRIKLGEQPFITSDFGARNRPVTPFGLGSSNHLGMDIRMEKGSLINSPIDGKVLFAGDRGGFGKLLEIKDSETGDILRFAHLGSLNVKPGDDIQKGMLIAKSGQSGKVTGPSLHFEHIQDGRHVNPELFIRKNFDTIKGKPMETQRTKITGDMLKKLSFNNDGTVSFAGLPNQIGKKPELIEEPQVPTTQGILQQIKNTTPGGIVFTSTEGLTSIPGKIQEQIALESVKSQFDKINKTISANIDILKQNALDANRPMSEKTADDMSLIPTISKNVGEIFNMLNNMPQDQLGPFAGKKKDIPFFGGYIAPEAQQVQALVKATSQNYGRFMEGGVLRKEDEIKYEKIFPQVDEVKPVRDFKAKLVQRMLISMYNDKIKALQLAGINTRGLKEIPLPDMPKIGTVIEKQNKTVIDDAKNNFDILQNNRGVGVYEIMINGKTKYLKAKTPQDAIEIQTAGGSRIP